MKKSLLINPKPKTKSKWMAGFVIPPPATEGAKLANERIALCLSRRWR